MKQVNPFLTFTPGAVALNPKMYVRQNLMAGLIPLLVITLILLANTVSAQFNINEIVTDYNGYWKSGQGAINLVKPDAGHNLISFSYSGNRYSTGVNDAALSAHGDLFIPGDYRALPVQSITGVANGNTKIGLGEMYDGVTNGKSSPSPTNNLPYYLTDGVKGLDIGTCVANLPAGFLNFAVSNVRLSAINDNIPDVVITQTADPSGSEFDRYEFTDINGNRIGNYVDIVLSNIPSVGNWVADFYEASTNPMALASGFTKTERGLRLWAADFSVFGIDASNISQIAYFKIRLNGNSDVAFVAYNNNAFNVDLILPIKLSSFSGKISAAGNDLNWQTVSESNTDKFIVERSTDGSSFMAIGTVTAAGKSTKRLNYHFTASAQQGTTFYRLKMVDIDGKSTYSATISLNSGTTTFVKLTAYPNPASKVVYIKHPQTKGAETIQVFNAQGLLVDHVKATNNQTSLNLSQLNRGTYHVCYQADGNRQITTLIVN